MGIKITEDNTVSKGVYNVVYLSSLSGTVNQTIEIDTISSLEEINMYFTELGLNETFTLISICRLRDLD